MSPGSLSLSLRRLRRRRRRPRRCYYRRHVDLAPMQLERRYDPAIALASAPAPVVRSDARATSRTFEPPGDAARVDDGLHPSGEGTRRCVEIAARILQPTLFFFCFPLSFSFSPLPSPDRLYKHAGAVIRLHVHHIVSSGQEVAAFSVQGREREPHEKGGADDRSIDRLSIYPFLSAPTCSRSAPA